MEFRSFDEIQNIKKAYMTITQKIHGSNAQVKIIPSVTPDLEPQVFVGSRNRWIAPGNDNYGFAAHVYAHKQEFIEKLGPGTHFGEWAGPGINSGEGLSEKTFVLFDLRKKDAPMPPNTVVVPCLYSGAIDFSQVDWQMHLLKTEGSRLVPGFMRPEGVVVQIFPWGHRLKRVFEAEETQWKRSEGQKVKEKVAGVDVSHLLQPVRLEKLLSRDERYALEYPKSLPTIVNDYMDDLVKEGQITGSEAEIKGLRKVAMPEVFKMVRELVNQ